MFDAFWFHGVVVELVIVLLVIDFVHSNNTPISSLVGHTARLNWVIYVEALRHSLREYLWLI